MASTTLKVLRWSFLGAGVFYGFWHNRTLASEAEAKRFSNDWAKKEKLIADAKAKYAELHKPKDAGNVVSDVNDPNFDVEKYISYSLENLKQ